MDTALVTGSAGSIGAEAGRFFSAKGFRIVGIDNDMRGVFFGPDASTEWSRRQLEAQIPSYFHQAVFVFTSTNKVYGANPNKLPLVEHDSRWEPDPYYAHGVDEKMSVDHTSDARKFQAHYPGWSYRYSLSAILREIYDSLASRFGNVARLAG